MPLIVVSPASYRRSQNLTPKHLSQWIRGSDFACSRLTTRDLRLTARHGLDDLNHQWAKEDTGPVLPPAPADGYPLKWGMKSLRMCSCAPFFSRLHKREGERGKARNQGSTAPWHPMHGRCRTANETTRREVGRKGQTALLCEGFEFGTIPHLECGAKRANCRMRQCKYLPTQGSSTNQL